MNNSNFSTTTHEADENLKLLEKELEENDICNVTEPKYNNEEVYIHPRPENLVITKLKVKKIYNRHLSNGIHEIDCLWKNEHVFSLGGENTFYHEPYDSNRLGSFRCYNDSCSSRHIWQLLEKLNVSIIEARNLPTIRLSPDNLVEILDHLEKELAHTGKYFQRDGAIVSFEPGTNEPIILELSVITIFRVLSKILRFEKFVRRKNEFISCHLPELYCRILHSSKNYSHLPVLHGLARQPYFRPDDSLVTEPGYDQDTGIYGIFDKTKFAIPDTPSRQDAEAALAILKSLLDEFGFQTEHDHSAALSAIFTATIRTSLRLAPMFHCNAHQNESGKSYLTTIFCTFAVDSSVPGTAFPATEEECRKLLVATQLQSPPVIHFDNTNSDIFPYRSLCTALTEEFLSDRILGGSKIAKVPTKTLFLSNGNNVGTVMDMCRRVITINLNPNRDVAAPPNFKKEPLTLVRSRREYFVSLVLTIIRAWIVAGRPITEVPPIATFAEWSCFCRQTLIWLGYPDPAKSMFLSREQDPDRELLGRLLHSWRANFGSRPVMIREAIVKGNHELREILTDITGDRDNPNRKRLGRWISRKAGCIVDGLKFVKDSSTRSAEAWRVKPV